LYSTVSAGAEGEGESEGDAEPGAPEEDPGVPSAGAPAEAPGDGPSPAFPEGPDDPAEPGTAGVGVPESDPDGDPAGEADVPPGACAPASVCPALAGADGEAPSFDAHPDRRTSAVAIATHDLNA